MLEEHARILQNMLQKTGTVDWQWFRRHHGKLFLDQGEAVPVALYTEKYAWHIIRNLCSGIIWKHVKY